MATNVRQWPHQCTNARQWPALSGNNGQLGGYLYLYIGIRIVCMFIHIHTFHTNPVPEKEETGSSMVPIASPPMLLSRKKPVVFVRIPLFWGSPFLSIRPTRHIHSSATKVRCVVVGHVRTHILCERCEAQT